MGREVRRVPPNWQHPKRAVGMVERYQPMRERDFTEAMHEWYAEWSQGKTDPLDNPPPDPAYYQHGLKPEECTWYQAYETVSEGTPVSPPFATQEELAQYLATNGDFWDQKRVKEGQQDGPAGWGIENARRFVGIGWAPSMVISNGVVLTARDGIWSTHMTDRTPLQEAASRVWDSLLDAHGHITDMANVDGGKDAAASVHYVLESVFCQLTLYMHEDDLTDEHLEALCSDCPPIGYPTNKTRCKGCPRRTEAL